MRKTRMQQTLPERKRRQKPTGHLQMPMKLQRMPKLQMSIRHRVLIRVIQRPGTVIRNENYRKAAAQTK